MSLNLLPGGSSHHAHRRLGICAAALLAVAAHAGPALASDPMGAYVVPTRVDMFPTDAGATTVGIHGSFIFLTNPDAGAMTYTSPRCGWMYFQCAAGDETLCRMQWLDLRAAIGKTYCAGFGSLNKLTAGTLREEGTATVSPDTWDLGIGVGMGSYVGGMCTPARALACPAGAGVDGGAVGGTGGAATASGGVSGGTGGGAGGVGGAPGTGGAASSTGGQRSGGQIGTGGTIGTGGAATGSGGTGGAGGQIASGGISGAGNKPGGGSGCAIADGRDAGSRGAPWWFLALVAASIRRSRRQASGITWRKVGRGR